MENQDIIERTKLERATKRVKLIAVFYRHLMVYILINVVLIATNYFTLDPGEKFWDFGTFATAFFWGIGLAFHAIGVSTETIFFGRKWEERKLREYMSKESIEKWE